MLLIAATMASTFAESRPSEKFGTHSISRFIVWASCSSLSSCRDAPSCLAALVLGLAASAAHKRSAALSPANLSRTSDSAPPEGPRGERLGPPERPFSAAWATWPNRPRTWSHRPLRSNHRLHPRGNSQRPFWRWPGCRSRRRDGLLIFCFLRKVASPLARKPNHCGYPGRDDQRVIGAEATRFPQDSHAQEDQHQKDIKILFEDAVRLRLPDSRKFQAPDGLGCIASSWTL